MLRIRRDLEKKLSLNLKLSRALSDFNKANATEVRGFLPQQVKTLKRIQESDVITILPTGYGKSLLFQVLPFFYTPPMPVIVACPLNAIITSHSDGNTHSFVMNDGDTVSNADLHEKYYIFGHPEQVRSIKKWQLT